MAAQRAVKAADEERELVQAARHGDEGAFRRIFDLQVEGVRAAAARVVGEGADADDVVQDTFLAAFRNLKRFQGRSSLRTWLYRIAVNFALQRRAASRLRDTAGLDCAVAGSEEGRMAARIDLHKALAAMALLDDGKRSALVLHELEGMTAEQIARSQGRPLSTVLSRLARGRRALAQLLSRQGRTR
jgi:RNA polymerase sigma-70 factor, ECF subfamily